MKFIKYAIGYFLLVVSFQLSRQEELFVLLAFWGGCLVTWGQFDEKRPHCEHGYNGICPVCDATKTPPTAKS